MSTAKKPSAETAAKDEKLTPADFAAILTTTLALAAEAGLTVGVRNRPPKDGRPAGLLVYVSGLAVYDGRLEAANNDEQHNSVNE